MRYKLTDTVSDCFKVVDFRTELFIFEFSFNIGKIRTIGAIANLLFICENK